MLTAGSVLCVVCCCKTFFLGVLLCLAFLYS